MFLGDLHTKCKTFCAHAKVLPHYRLIWIQVYAQYQRTVRKRDGISLAPSSPSHRAAGKRNSEGLWALGPGLIHCFGAGRTWLKWFLRYVLLLLHHCNTCSHDYSVAFQKVRSESNLYINNLCISIESLDCFAFHEDPFPSIPEKSSPRLTCSVFEGVKILYANLQSKSWIIMASTSRSYYKRWRAVLFELQFIPFLDSPATQTS